MQWLQLLRAPATPSGPAVWWWMESSPAQVGATAGCTLLVGNRVHVSPKTKFASSRRAAKCVADHSHRQSANLSASFSFCVSHFLCIAGRNVTNREEVPLEIISDDDEAQPGQPGETGEPSGVELRPI